MLLNKHISNTGFVKKTTFMRLLILYYLKSFVKFPIKQMNHLIFIFKWFQCNTQQHMPQTRCRKVYTRGLFHKQAQVFWALLQSSPSLGGITPKQSRSSVLCISQSSVTMQRRKHLAIATEPVLDNAALYIYKIVSITPLCIQV